MSRAEDFIIKKGIMTQYTGSDTVDRKSVV